MPIQADLSGRCSGIAAGSQTLSRSVTIWSGPGRNLCGGPTAEPVFFSRVISWLLPYRESSNGKHAILPMPSAWSGMKKRCCVNHSFSYAAIAVGGAAIFGLGYWTAKFAKSKASKAQSKSVFRSSFVEHLLGWTEPRCV